MGLFMATSTESKTASNPFVWDSWQQEVLDYKGNVTLRTGRQVGKSEVTAEKSVKFARENAGTITLIIAASQRQAGFLFEKVRSNLDRLAEEGDDLYAEPPTLTKIVLKNGSRIYSLPAGRTGFFIRGMTIDLLIVDEAAYVPEVVWNSILPMIAVSKQQRGMGWIILLSTPFGKGGYYYESFTDPDFKPFHISSEDCPRISKEFLQKERLRMSSIEYRQEYQGEFTDDSSQFFSTDLIKSRMTIQTWDYKTDFVKGARYYLGVDFARYGGDENAFTVVEMQGKKLRLVKVETTYRVSTTDTIGRILNYNKDFNFCKIFVDDGGLGGAITDLLQDKLGRKVMGLNNSSKRIEVQGEEKKRGILKEDLYSNMLALMENAQLDMISDPYLMKSLKSITFEYGSEEKTTSRNVRIFGLYGHIAEAAVRGCWCTQERGLSLYVC